MIKVNTSALEASLEKAKLEIKRRLENMVKEFTYQSTIIFIDKTPYGDADANDRYYQIADRLRYFPSALEGSAKAGWFLGVGEPSLDPYPSPTSRDASDIKSRANADSQSYTLGERVFIANYVPYVAKSGWTQSSFGSLEEGYSAQAPEGIRKPSVAEIQALYQQNLQRYYDAN